MAISHQVRPHDGWKFFEKATNTTIITLTHQNLVDAVREHRKSNGITMGDVVGDVDAQLEAKHPSLSI